jgi:hypothetical protein
MSAERGPEVRESDERRTASGAAAGEIYKSFV